MSVQKALLISAIPFAVARLQSTVNRNAFIVNGVGNAVYNNGNYGDDQGVGASRKRKRARLNNLSFEEKTRRRKLLNREAAQNARDRANERMSQLQKQLAQLTKEKNQLMRENLLLKENHTVLQSENTDLRTGISKSESINMIKISEEKAAGEFPTQCSKGSVEHASLINVPLLKGQDLLTHSLLLILTLIGELMNASFPFHMNQIPICQSILMTTSSCPAVLELFMKLSQLKNCLKNLTLSNP